MGRRHSAAPLVWVAALPLSAGVLLFAWAFRSDSNAQQVDPNHRVIAPALACDDCTGPAPASPTAASPNTTTCFVTNVVDGDTFDCQDGDRVRLILIDTPEVHGREDCYGREASDYTKRNLLGKTVQLERDVSETDRYGRLLRYAWLGGELYNERIVRDGYARLATFPPDVKYLDRIQAAEREAREANRGLWGACPGDTTPTPTATATPPPTKPPYTVPACYVPGRDSCNCSDFTTQDHAQWFHNNYDPADVNHLDNDNDGVVCESLPKK